MKVYGQQKAEKSADHEQIAVGEIDHSQNAIDHGVAQGDERVDAAQLQSVKRLLEDIDHKVKLKLPYFKFPLF